MKNEDSHEASRARRCPRCNGSAYRIERRFVDLLMSIFVPLRRYRCGRMGCIWEGNLRPMKSR